MDPLVPMDHLEPLVPQDLRDLKDLLDSQGQQVRKDQAEQWVSLEDLVFKALQVTLDLADQQDLPELKETLVFQDLQAQ